MERMGESRSVYRVLVGYLSEVGLFEDIGVCGKVILKCIPRKQEGDVDWIDLALNRARGRLL